MLRVLVGIVQRSAKMLDNTSCFDTLATAPGSASRKKQARGSGPLIYQKGGLKAPGERAVGHSPEANKPDALLRGS